MFQHELSCKELVELVTEYLEETLPPQERARVEAHLDDCPPCRAYISQMRETICLVGKLSEDSISPEAKGKLLEVFRGWKSQN